MSPTTTLHAHLCETSSFRLLWSLWGGLTVVDIGHLVGMDDAMLVTAVALWVAGCCVHADAWTALAAGAVAWLVVDGFVVNELGTLRIDGTSDAMRAALLVGAALAGTRIAR